MLTIFSHAVSLPRRRANFGPRRISLPGGGPALPLAVTVCPFLYRFSRSRFILLPQKQALKYAGSMAPALLKKRSGIRYGKRIGKSPAADSSRSCANAPCLHAYPAANDPKKRSACIQSRRPVACAREPTSSVDSISRGLERCDRKRPQFGITLTKGRIDCQRRYGDPSALRKNRTSDKYLS